MRLDFLKRPHTIVLTLILACQATIFYGFSRGSEQVPTTRSLDEFPKTIGSWSLYDQGTIEQDVKDVLRADDYLTRVYTEPDGAAELFVAYFKSQRAGQTPHSPKNCLPGSGWIWTVSDTIPVSVSQRQQPIVVNRYIVSRGEDRRVMLYWYQSRDRVVASEYKAAAFTVADAIRYNHTDTALVRVGVASRNGHDDVATATAIQFIQAFYNTLRQFFPA